MISVIVPTFNERDNVTKVAKAIMWTLRDREFEIIFVDDSTDDTEEILQSLAQSDPRLRLEHRASGRGLGTAVVRGFQLAAGDVLAVMDADMQHPPEMLLPMLAKIEEGYDVVVPSRFMEGGSDGGLSGPRKIISATARHMAYFALKRLRKTTDPTSGFFMFRQGIIGGVTLRPIGWKILIEVLARGNYARVAEIPYAFQSRGAGRSKMSIKEQWNYMRHLARLVWESPDDRRIYVFAAVGLSGVLLNSLVYILLMTLGLPPEPSGLLSALAALSSNFALNDSVTWRERHDGETWLTRARKYALASLGGIVIDVTILSTLVRGMDANLVLANLAGIGAATVWNFGASNRWVWKKRPASVRETR